MYNRSMHSMFVCIYVQYVRLIYVLICSVHSALYIDNNYHHSEQTIMQL